MNPLLDKLQSTMKLSDNESSILTITEDGTDAEVPEEYILIARVLSTRKVWLTTFQRQMAEHWDGRFKVNIKEHHSDLFLLCFGCEGDRLRALEKEPWHFQNNHIILLDPTLHQTITPNIMIFSPFWVQAYRLPFMSKSRSLAKSLASILGEFLAVHDDSLNEGWGPFLRFRVKMDITKPLLRGRLISLPKIRDEFWVEFRYERLPNYCMECGLIGHLYQKCSVFLEKLDQGIEPELPYGPELKGSRLPTSSYDRYRTDFSKGNAWPLLTRLARNTLTDTIPRLRTTPKPQPKIFLMGESSNSTPEVPVTCSSNTDPRMLVVSTGTSSTSFATQPPTTSLFTPPSLNNSSLINPPLPFNLPNTAPGFDVPVNNKGKSIFIPNSNNNSPLLIDVYTPDLETKATTTNVFATYPPMINSSHIKSQSLQPHSVGAIQFSAVSTTAPATLHTTRATFKGQENVHPNRTFKRQYDTNSMRQTLKRCRANQSAQPSLSEGISPHQSVSTGLDSIDVQDNSAVIAQQSRDSP
ncbi:hypothetical protein CsatB_019222 [Cannabis sativa]